MDRQAYHLYFNSALLWTIFRTIEPTDYWTFGLLGFRTIRPSDYWDLGLSDYWTFWAVELLGFRTGGLSGYRAFGLLGLRMIWPKMSSRMYCLMSSIGRTCVDLCRWMLDTGFNEYI